MNFDSYSPPVLDLIRRGETGLRTPLWPDYRGLGLDESHISELIRIIEEAEDFFYQEDDDAPENCAPIHAWRALGQLDAVQAVGPLMALAAGELADEIDWITEEVPTTLALIGPPAIPPLKAYLLSPHREEWASIHYAAALEQTAELHPQTRADCVEILTGCLAGFAENEESLNAFLILNLAKLKAVESVNTVQQAFAADRVDISVMGDFEDFQVEVGLLEKRLTPPPRYHPFTDPVTAWAEDKAAVRAVSERDRAQQKKQKAKRKQAKQTKRKQRKKK